MSETPHQDESVRQGVYTENSYVAGRNIQFNVSTPETAQSSPRDQVVDAPILLRRLRELIQEDAVLLRDYRVLLMDFFARRPDTAFMFSLEEVHDLLPGLRKRLPPNAIMRASIPDAAEVPSPIEFRPNSLSRREISEWLASLAFRVHVGSLDWGSRPVELSWHLADSADLPVSIYIADETIHENVETAIEHWLTAAGLDIAEWGEPVIGSWFRALRAAAKQAVNSGVVQDATLTAVHAADTRLVLYQDAQTTALLLQNLGPVITALQPTKDAVIRAGALLIVKVDWQIQVFQLTAAQQAVLDHRPRLASSPYEIIQALQLSQPVTTDEALPAAE